ncbi:MAG: DUF4071 domain-containing protein [Magnetococcales bacterium]|nr:DUF4071 domain-containing protein [Magnetococcales bacterium]
MTETVKSVEALLLEGESLIHQGRPTAAFNLLSQAALLHPSHARLHYLAALAMVNCGSLSMGRTHLNTVLKLTSPGDPLHVDALSLNGRISKEQYARHGAHDTKQAAAVESLQWYRQAFDQSRDFFPGINAATMACLAGEAHESRRLAREVLLICESTGQPETDPWAAATMGEVHVLLSNRVLSEHWYRHAVALADNRMGYWVSMRRQLALLANKLPLAGDLTACFPIPNVAMFVGHMLDNPGRHTPRFLPSMVAKVAQQLREAICQMKIGIGYVSLACGSDILFAEALLEQNLEVNIWLPFRLEDFLQTSVAFAGQEWVDRCHAVLARATSVSYAIQEPFLGDHLLFEYTNQLLMGACLTRATQLGVKPFLLAVAAPGGPTLSGGTLDSVQQWRKMGHHAECIELDPLSPRPGTSDKSVDGNPTPSFHDALWYGKRVVRTMLFADMVGFSKIAEDASPAFLVHFLGKISEVITRSSRPPIFRNSWGDGLFLVFDSFWMQQSLR